ncbi:MAG: AlpA family phage regulatory protein [Proteobacteria bacterium]|nr:AlpA family phage regulatory protein [Pseudomonadota bacterium]
MNSNVLPEWQHWRINTVMQVTALARSTIWKMVKEGRFPAPKKLSQRVTAWNAADVRAWLEGKAEGTTHGA